MGPEAEGDVVVGGPGDVELLGPVEHVRVAVGRSVHQHDLLAGGHRDAGHLRVGGGYAAHVVDGGDEADHLLDRHRDVGTGPQLLPLLGPGDQVEQSPGDHRAGRLRPAVE